MPRYHKAEERLGRRRLRHEGRVHIPTIGHVSTYRKGGLRVMITRAQDIVLNVQPIFFEIKHLYRYEGPCRSGVGDQLEPEFDLLRNEEWWNTFTEDMATRLPSCVNVMEPLRFTRTDNWDDEESMWEEIGKTAAEADFYIFHSFLGLDGLVVEFAERFGKPCCVEPEYINPCSATSIGAALAARDKDYEFYGFRNWADLSKQLEVLRARKVIGNTRILLPVRFSSSVSMSSVDRFPIRRRSPRNSAFASSPSTSTNCSTRCRLPLQAEIQPRPVAIHGTSPTRTWLRPKGSPTSLSPMLAKSMSSDGGCLTPSSPTSR